MVYKIDTSKYERYDNNECIRYKKDIGGYFIYLEQYSICKDYDLKDNLSKLVDEILKNNKKMNININVHYPNNEARKIKELQIYENRGFLILFMLDYIDENMVIPFFKTFENNEQLRKYIKSKVIKKDLRFYLKGS
ncbi:hypothetical protein YN1_4830 [Nanoarchaeota archaeon]